MLRLAKNGGRTEEHLFYIKHWQCPVCARRKPPGPVARSSARARPEQFNVLVGVDLKEVRDSEGQRHVYLNILDIATRYSCLVRLETKQSYEVSQAFIDYWISWAGCPESVLMDQGGEFEGEFQAVLTRFGIGPRVIATEAPWQNGMVERHGGVLGEILSLMVDQCQLRGPEDMAAGGHMAASSKNRRPDRTGHSARARVFGTTERMPGSVIDAIQDGEKEPRRDRSSTEDRKHR